MPKTKEQAKNEHWDGVVQNLLTRNRLLEERCERLQQLLGEALDEVRRLCNNAERTK